MEAWVAREEAVNGENVYFAWGRRCCDVAQFCNNDDVSWVGWGGVEDQGWGGPRPVNDEFHHIVFTFDGVESIRQKYFNVGVGRFVGRLERLDRKKEVKRQ